MTAIRSEQRKSIYAMGRSLNLLEQGNHDDNLHHLVAALTGRESISVLTAAEADTVIADLKEKMRGNFSRTGKSKPISPAPGGMSKGQQGMVWHLMYRLARLDSELAGAELGARLCGIIRRQLRVDVTQKEPFRWLTYQQGARLIEFLKKYVSTAEQRRTREG